MSNANDQKAHPVYLKAKAMKAQAKNLHLSSSLVASDPSPSKYDTPRQKYRLDALF